MLNYHVVLNCPLKNVLATTFMKKAKVLKAIAHTRVCKQNVKPTQMIVVFIFNGLKLHDFEHILDALNRSSHEKRHVGTNANHKNVPKRYLFC